MQYWALHIKDLTNVEINKSFFQSRFHLLFYEAQYIIFDVRFHKGDDCIQNLRWQTSSGSLDNYVAVKEKIIIQTQYSDTIIFRNNTNKIIYFKVIFN